MAIDKIIVPTVIAIDSVTGKYLHGGASLNLRDVTKVAFPTYAHLGNYKANVRSFYANILMTILRLPTVETSASRGTPYYAYDIATSAYKPNISVAAGDVLNVIPTLVVDLVNAGQPLWATSCTIACRALDQPAPNASLKTHTVRFTPNIRTTARISVLGATDVSAQPATGASDAAPSICKLTGVSGTPDAWDANSAVITIGAAGSNTSVRAGLIAVPDSSTIGAVDLQANVDLLIKTATPELLQLCADVHAAWRAVNV